MNSLETKQAQQGWIVARVSFPYGNIHQCPEDVG